METTTNSQIAIASGVAPDPAWTELSRRWFVYGVGADDQLVVRGSAGADGEVVTSLDPDATNLRRFGEVTFVNDHPWSPIVVAEEPAIMAGWVDLRHLRPLPVAGSPVHEGAQQLSDEYLGAIIEALDAPEALAPYVSDAGLTVATEPAITGREATITSAELEAGAGQEQLWGTEAGTGAEIRRTGNAQLSFMRGSTALTSTEQIGHQVQLSHGNIPNTIDEAFPGSLWVEYRFGGTEWFSYLDWQSITLVFAAATEPEVTVAEHTGPLLLAVVAAAWTP